MISDIMAATSSSRSTASRRTASAAPCVAKVEEASHHVLVKALTEKVVRYRDRVVSTENDILKDEKMDSQVLEKIGRQKLKCLRKILKD